MPDGEFRDRPVRPLRHLSLGDPGRAGGQPLAPTPLRPPDQRSVTRAARPAEMAALYGRPRTDSAELVRAALFAVK
jgi:hypothetical protein